MIVFLKRFILILVLLFSLPSVFSADGVCCYTPGIDSGAAIYPVAGTSAQCQSGDFTLGDITDASFAGSQTDACKLYKDKRVSYQPGSSCFLTVDGNRLYDVTNVGEHLVEWLFDNDHISTQINPLNDLSSNLSCTSGSPTPDPDIGAGSGNPGDEDSQGGNVVANPFENFTPADPTDLSGTANDVPQETIDLCSQAGGPFGFYTSKTSCESFTISGQEACLYNPHLAGYFSTQSSIFSILLQGSESACVPKASINSCYDYKTKNACQNNDAKGVSSSKLLESGCSWVDYGPTSQLSEERGYCISKEQLDNGPNKLLNRFHLADRLNLVKDPSFEFGGEWVNVNGGNPSAVFQGNNASLMIGGNRIYQDINNIAPGASYIIHLYAMFEDVNNINDSELEIVITENTGRGVTLVPVSGYDLSTIFNENYPGYYEKVAFTPYTASDDVTIIEFSIRSTGGPMYIDGVNMEYSPATDAGNPDLIFKPVEVISPSASSCELCFDPLNLNMCDMNRANNLGDCSYMPNDISQPYFTENPEYLGRDFGNGGNIYMSNERRWESQSLANGLLFCEMYVDKPTCEDGYVNSHYGLLHSGNSLCSWDDTNNICFKDSDKNNIPDVLKGVPSINSFTRGSVDSTNYLSSYNFTRNGNQPSDFELACDTIPPTAYIYFTGLNQSGERVMLGDGGGQSYGDVRIQGYVNDFLPPACEPFNIDGKIFIDANISPSGDSPQDIVYEIPSNQEKFDISIKDYFVDTNGGQIITDGNTNIQLEFYDQSGNKYAGGAKNLNVNFDGQGPQIVLENEDELTRPEGDELVPKTLGKDFIFNFNVSDNSIIDSCKYMLEPTPNSQARNGNYNETGEIEVPPTSSEFDFDMNVTEIIFNTTKLTGDAFLFTIECEDAFGQKGQWSNIILVDLRTEFALLSPLEYLSPELSQGFYNENQEFWMASKDEELESCNYEFEGENSQPLLTDPINGGFFLPEEYGYSGVNFSVNITGDMNFQNPQGYKNVTLTCIDAQDNEYIMNLDYYYDTTFPLLEKVEYVNKTLSDGGNNFIKVGEDYYFRTQGDSLPNPEVRFFVDGTNSWIDEEMNITVFIAEGVSASHDFIANINYNESTFKNNFTHTNFESDLTEIYGGEETQYEGVREYIYTLNFKDKANNSASEQFSYFVDNSVAELTFEGDVREGENNRVYTAQTNPFIRMNFNAPDYKEFTCNVTASLVGLSGQFPTQEFGPDTQISYNLDQLAAIQNQFENGFNVRLLINCEDQYGTSPIGANNEYYELIYDNVNPEFTDLSLSGSNPKYLYFIGPGVQYEDIVDRFVYEFENTQEEGYVCSLQVLSNSNDYICDDTTFEETLGSSTQAIGEQRNIVDLGQSNSGLQPICEVSSSINDPKITTITFRASCEDLAGNVAQEVKELDVQIIFTDSFLLPPLEFDYEPGEAYPKVKSFNQLSSPEIEIYIDDISVDPIHTYTASAQQEGDIYVLKSQTPIDLGGFNSGEYMVRAEVSSGLQNLGSVTGTLIVDNDAPIINIDVPDNNEGIVYGLEFMTEIFGEDVGSAGFEKVELFINGDKVLENDEILDDQKVSSLIMDFSGDSDSQVDGEVNVINGQDGQLYELIVVATDKAGNQAQDSINITLDNSFNIVLEDSNNAFARTQNEWLTRVDQPTLNFRTTKTATCSLRIPSHGEVENSGTSFSFNVAQDYPGLSMEDQEEITTLIECDYEGNTISKQVGIKYTDAIPDYVLYSSEGFVITNPPYVTNLSVKNVVDFISLESCSYVVGGVFGEITSFDESSNSLVDMDALSNGEHTLELTCVDIMGYSGPTKEYNFVIDKGPLQVENVTFVSTNHRAEVENTQAFLREGEDYRLEFRANKKEVVCDYIELNTSGNFIEIIFNFFKKLFNIGQQDLFSSQPFVYQSNILQLNETGTYEIEVNCDPPSGIDGSYVQTINIERLDGSQSINNVEVSIN